MSKEAEEVQRGIIRAIRQSPDQSLRVRDLINSKSAYLNGLANQVDDKTIVHAIHALLDYQELTLTGDRRLKIKTKPPKNKR